MEPEVERGQDSGVVDTGFGDDVGVRVEVDIRDAKVKSIEGADLEGVQAIIGFNEIIVKWLEFPIILP